VAALIRIDHSFTSRENPSGAVRFCSRCGQPAEEPPRSEDARERSRVCEACGMGMLLSCERGAVPGARAAFLIGTVELEVSAVSEGAERLLGDERAILGRSMLDVLTSPFGHDKLARAVRGAAMRASDPQVMPVRGTTEKAGAAGTLAARISTCGPPRAALVTVEPSGFGVRG
jgi:hypothetical protein